MLSDARAIQSSTDLPHSSDQPEIGGLVLTKKRALTWNVHIVTVLSYVAMRLRPIGAVVDQADKALSMHMGTTSWAGTNVMEA